MSDPASTRPAARSHRAVVGALLLAIASAGAADAQTDTGRFVVIKGTDTLVTERLTRTRSELRGHLVWQNGVEMSYTARLLANGSVDLFEVSFQQDGKPRRLVARQAGSNVVIRVGDDSTTKAGGPGLVPLVPASIALLEQTILAGRSRGGGARFVPTLVTMETRVDSTSVTAAGADSVVVASPDGRTIRFKVDRAGHVLGGFNPSSGVEIRRDDYLAEQGVKLPAERARSQPPAKP